jgi:ribosomal protein L37AE/L43A
MPQCPACGKEISERIALFQHVCDDCIEILADVKAQQDEEMQQTFDSQ